MSPVYKFSNVGGFLTKNLYTSALAGNAVVQLDKGSMDPIQTITLASASASIDFTSIPQTYTHLQARIFAKNTRTGSNSASGFFEVNGDTSINNYTTHYLNADGASATAFGRGTGFYTGLSTLFPSADVSNVFGTAIYDFLDYKNTNKYKTVRCFNGWDGNGSGNVQLSSNLWLNSNAITSIKFTIPGYNWSIGSSFVLYGINA